MKFYIISAMCVSLAQTGFKCHKGGNSKTCCDGDGYGPNCCY